MKTAAIALCVAASILAAGAVAAQELPTEIQARGTLRIGTSLAGIPWSFFDADHKATGIDVEFCTDLASRLGLEPDYVQLEFQSLIPALQANRIDIACSGVFITPERQEVVDLHPYITTSMAILTREEDVDLVKEAGDLCGKSVSALQGSSQLKTVTEMGEACVSDGKPEITISAFQTQPLALQELRNDRVDAFVASDQLAGFYATQEVGLAKALTGINPVLVGVATSKASPEFGGVVGSLVAEMVAEDTYRTFLQKWNVESAAYTPQ